MQDLPDNLYCVESVVRLEQAAIQHYGIPAYDLMKRAGAAVFNIIQARYSQSKKLLVLCGAGNNAGDGYVVARLARQAGYDVRVIALVEPALLKNEASLAYQDWLHASGQLEGYEKAMYLRRQRQSLLWKLLGDDVIEGLPAFRGDPLAELVSAVVEATGAASELVSSELERILELGALVQRETRDGVRFAWSE
jgi:NAD(P)H-hydrate repair Nnr-like enzyme with NAD(P)H-hydrate epimerase domain